MPVDNHGRVKDKDTQYCFMMEDINIATLCLYMHSSFTAVGTSFPNVAQCNVVLTCPPSCV